MGRTVEIQFDYYT